MPKSAFKSNGIHLHILVYSVNLPSVFFFHFRPSVSITVELFVVDVGRVVCVCVSTLCVKLILDEGGI